MNKKVLLNNKDYLYRKKDRKLKELEVYEVKNPYQQWKEFDIMMKNNGLNEPCYNLVYLEFPHNTTKDTVNKYITRVYGEKEFFKYNNHVYIIMYQYDC